MEAANPLISVLIGVKNGGDKFNLTMDSLAAQSLDRSLFEVLICNDGSTDNTRELIQKWEKKGVCRLAHENAAAQGLAKSLLELRKYAKGKYLARVDAGDISSPDRLARQLEYLEKNPGVGLVCSTTLLMFQDGKIIGPLFSPLSKDIQLRHLLKKNIIVHGSIMMRKEAYDATGGYDPSFESAEDFDLWTKMLSLGIKLHWLKLPLYRLELDDQGTSVKKKEIQAGFRRQIMNRYKKSELPLELKGTDLNAMRRNATLRALPGLGTILKFVEGIVFEIKSSDPN